MNPQLTVIVCTRNRVGPLALTLKSLKDQSEVGKYEVIVVDNMSTDGTLPFLQDEAAGWPDLRFAKEEELGLSASRNCGITMARGEIIAFLDDDATAEAEWAHAHMSAYESPEILAVAGHVSLGWPGDARPTWLPASLDHYYSSFELGDRPRFLTDLEIPVGTNMSMRRAVAEQLGGFDRRLGRVGSNLLSFEENEFFQRVRTHGRILYQPDARIVHHIPPDRVSIPWLARRAFANGVSEVIYERISPTPPKSSPVKRLLIAVVKASANLFRWPLGPSNLPTLSQRFTRSIVRSAYLFGVALETTKDFVRTPRGQ